MTLKVVRYCDSVLVTRRAVVPASSGPIAKLAPTTGTVTSGAPSVPENAAVAPGAPLLKMTTPAAPCCSALSAFVPKVQLPRWISAMAPAGKPLKSAASQPLVEGVVVTGVRSVSTGTTWPSAVPDPE